MRPPLLFSNPRAGFSAAVSAGGLAAISIAATGALPAKRVVPAVILAIVAVSLCRRVVAWSTLVAVVIATILFIPIKRYALPGGLPFQLEPYRIMVALIAAGWLTSLLVDPRVKPRRSAFDGPIVLYLVAIVLSLVMNPHRTSSLSADILKSLLFFVSFIILYYLILSVIRTPEAIDRVVRALAVGATALGISAIVESRTGYNVFDHLSKVVPILKFQGAVVLSRGGRLRVVGSGQHPIAFGAALVMLAPLAVYMAQVTRRRRWWLAFFLIIVGALGTGSRTATTMLFACVLVYIAFQPQRMKRMWPALLPAFLVIHVVMPGAIGTTVYAFFPSGGIVAQQQDAGVGSARLSTLGPVLHEEVSPDPVFGEGYATRITTPSPTTPVPNAPITDDEWLSSLAEVGILGNGALLWLFVSFFRRLRRTARGDDSPRAPLLAALAASVTAFAVGMLTYDAFSFIQVTFLLYIFLAIGAAAVAAPRDEWGRFDPLGGVRHEEKVAPPRQVRIPAAVRHAADGI